MKSNPLVKIKNILLEIDDILNEYLVDYNVVKREIFEKIDEKDIKIMVYGVFNAGKSTLINSLLGEERAKIDDIPTTDKISSYEWKGYKLLDTPGINAPIEHEKISKEELLKNDLIVFVIRKDDEDSEIIYKEIFDLLKHNKNIFLVFNYSGLDKNGEGEGSLKLSLDKLNEQLLKYADETNINFEKVKSINIIPVNLKTALKGRLQNKQKLIEYSGLIEFEEKFYNWLNELNMDKVILKSLKNYIDKKIFEQFFKKIKINNNELEEYIEELEHLNLRKNLIKNEVKLFIMENINQILYKFQKYIENEDFSPISKEIDDFYSELEIFLKDKIDETNIYFRKKVINIPKIEISIGENENIDITKILEKIPLPIKIPAEIINFIITIISKDKETEKINKQRKKMLLHAYQLANDIKNKIEYSSMKQTDDFINKSFEKIEYEYTKKIKEIQSKLNKTEKDFEKVKNAKLRIEKLNF